MTTGVTSRLRDVSDIVKLVEAEEAKAPQAWPLSQGDFSLKIQMDPLPSFEDACLPRIVALLSEKYDGAAAKSGGVTVQMVEAERIGGRAQCIWPLWWSVPTTAGHSMEAR